MATQAQATEQLRRIQASLSKVGNETGKLLEKILELQAQMEAEGEISSELQEALDAVAEQAQKIDEMVPDAGAPADPGMGTGEGSSIGGVGGTGETASDDPADAGSGGAVDPAGNPVATRR